jgi:hypothetical protein
MSEGSPLVSTNNTNKCFRFLTKCLGFDKSTTKAENEHIPLKKY